MSTDFFALNYLAVFDRDLPFESDMIYRDRLAHCHLDYSINSLRRIDQFLDDIREQEHPLEQDFLEEHAKYSLLHLLCFYVGEVVGRARGMPFHWYNYQEMVERSPAHKIFGDAFYTTACCDFPHLTGVDIGSFLPLNAIMTRMFDDDGKSVSYSAGLFLPPVAQNSISSDLPLKKVPPMDLGIDMSRQPEKLSEDDQLYLKTDMPSWAKTDDISRFFYQQDNLIRSGKIVWAALIQANSSLLQQGHNNSGGEIIYDPDGRMPVEDIHRVAQHIFKLKGKTNLNAQEQYIADYLENENIRVFGLDVPSSILPYPLKISTTYFNRKHLPEGVLSLPYFPVLLDDAGIAMIVPSKYWNLAFRQQWLDIAKEKSTHDPEVKQKTDEVIAKRVTEAEILYERGLQFYKGQGIARDFAIAHSCWLQSAQQGYPLALNNLGILYENGQGVAENPILAFDYYRQAAEKGLAVGQLNVGKMYFKGYGVSESNTQAKEWFIKSANQGNEEAKKILVDFSSHFVSSQTAVAVSPESKQRSIVVRIVRNLFLIFLVVLGILLLFGVLAMLNNH
jgi:hypothetical protein